MMNIKRSFFEKFENVLKGWGKEFDLERGKISERGKKIRRGG